MDLGILTYSGTCFERHLLWATLCLFLIAYGKQNCFEWYLAFHDDTISAALTHLFCKAIPDLRPIFIVKFSDRSKGNGALKVLLDDKAHNETLVLYVRSCSFITY